MSSSPEALASRLDLIRAQASLKLDNQKNIALILSAVEENLAEQKSESTPSAYFVSFLALLEQAVSEDGISDTNVALAAAYLLDVVMPYTPEAVLKHHFGQILARLAPLLSGSDVLAAMIRSSVGSLESLLLAQPTQLWKSAGNVSPRRGLVGMLELALDPRPKVRKRAQEAVHRILASPPASPSPYHPAAALCAELVLKRLTALLEETNKSRKSQQNRESSASLIHALQLVGSITSANAWPPAHIEVLCDRLLDVLRALDQYVVAAAFSAFDGLFAAMNTEIDAERFARVLDIIFDLKPSQDDTHLAAPWLAVVAHGVQAYAKVLPELCLERLPKFVPVIAQFLAAESKDIYTSAGQCLIAVTTESIPDDWLLNPGAELSPERFELVDDTITFIAEYLQKELFSIKYQHATREILELVTAVVNKLRFRANPDFLAILEVVGSWRTNEEANFPFNKEAEDFVGACVANMGPEAVLGVLPLNLALGKAAPGRAWMLPILRDNVRFASLAFFQQTIFPLVADFEARISLAPNKDAMHVKIFKTIVDQVWSLLPHFCDLPRDLPAAFTDDFAATLADLLYLNVDVRVNVCHALRLLVESNLAYSQGALSDDKLMTQEFSLADASSNIEFLSSKAANILSVLFNVFSSTMPDARGYVLETIDTYLQIVPKSDLESTFDKVCGLLKKALDDEAGSAPQPAKNALPSLSVTMTDLVVAMAKYIPSLSYNALFSIFNATVALKDRPLLQKRSYRILSKLGESESGEQALLQFLSDIETVFIQTVDSTHTSARASRLAALAVVVKLLPTSDLFFIPSILQEVIVSTKEVNEASRETAYNLLIQMGRKMAEGGIVHNGKVPEFDDSTPDSEASLPEFITMVSAGLAAQLPHMISATITALSCLTFEFKDELPLEVMVELASTVELFLTHRSREIAKSAIGFVKVEVLCLPEEMIRANLSQLLTKLMTWSHEHKGHFKTKVKHIVERLIRKFGVEAVEEAIPEEDRKLVANIKKTRARAKRREAESEGADAKTGKQFVSAYEEAVYDSESEDEQDEPEPVRRKRQDDKYILDTGDEPLDLLDRKTLAKISSSKPKSNARKSKQTDFQTKNGKLVFKDMVDGADPLADKTSGIDAYLDAVKQAPVRGQKNKLKFKKTKDNESWSDDEEDRSRTQKTALKARVGKPRPNPKMRARKKL